MKKLLVICVIILLPISALAGMSTIPDSEMATVTGQMGVSIAIIDQQQDISIASVTWGDVNTSSRYIAGQATNISPGYINLNDISINKNTTTDNDVSTPVGRFADPYKIDVVSFGAVSATQPFVALANKTAVIISLPDELQTIDSITIGSITLDSSVATVTTTAGGSARGTAGFYAALNTGAQYAYTNTFAAVNSHQLGQLYVQGFKQIGYSHLEGYNSAGSLPAYARPAYIAIFAHDATGN